MSSKSHKSPISSLLEVIDGWRKAGNKSRETAAEEIVCAHERIDGPARTGVFFEPRTTDVFKRMHTNAAKFFRWMDDESKDTNLLSVNMLPSVLAALPEDARVEWLNSFVRPLGLSVRSLEQEAGAAIDITKVLRANLKESADAHSAMVDYAENPSEDARRRVEKELAEQEEVAHKARLLFASAASVSSINEARVA
jgi:hypothetical protein